LFDLTKDTSLYQVKISDSEILYLKSPSRDIEVRILNMYNENYKELSNEEKEAFIYNLGCDIIIGRFDHIENIGKRKLISKIFNKPKVIDKDFVASMRIEQLANLIFDYMETFYKLNKKK